jgi:hypothetical protein
MLIVNKLPLKCLMWMVLVFVNLFLFCFFTKLWLYCRAPSPPSSRTIPFFGCKELYPNPPWSLSLLVYFEATTKYLGSLPSPPISLPPNYDSFVVEQFTFLHLFWVFLSLGVDYGVWCTFSWSNGWVESFVFLSTIIYILYILILVTFDVY